MESVIWNKVFTKKDLEILVKDLLELYIENQITLFEFLNSPKLIIFTFGPYKEVNA